ncbi:MAG: PQQ-binding-like beta-propeller repeat protein [Pseudomonadales bacterium]|nr:PQQ-binding-like beta-propeller repeat protein [Pseudomonadales bacterium]
MLAGTCRSNPDSKENWRTLNRNSLVMLLIAFLTCTAGTELAAQNTGWTYWGGNKAFDRYSALDQINADNVADLKIIWRRPALDPTLQEAFSEIRVTGNLRSTPVYIDGVLYATNAIGLAEAFDPATGATLWVQQPPAATSEEARGQSTRGLEYWSDGGEGRILVVRNGYLYALNPANGLPITDFGTNGRVSLVPDNANQFSFVSGGPIVVNDVIVVAGTVDGAGDSGTRWRGAASEDVRAYDVRSGAQLWTFHAVPEQGEFGTDTWGNDSWRDSGDLGSWCCLSADESLGMVYVPFTAPTAAYYGGHRPGDNLFSNSLVAIDVSTGERVWHFQMVHHDVWEYDNVGPPVLGDINVNGRTIPAVMQANKTGWIYVFNRVTGEPVWPIEERPVPQSDVPGELLSATQPFPTRPPPIATQGISEADIIDYPELGQLARAEVANFVIGPIFTPPTLISTTPGGTQGTLTLPGSWGSANWNTGAFDPETGYYYGFANDIPRVYRLEATNQEEAEMPYWSPNREAPYLDGIPLTRPPWGRITAIDMNRGEHLWQVANGDSLGDHPALSNLDLPDLGIASRPVALVTRTLLFIGDGSNVFGGTQPNMWGRTFRALDKATGETVWEMELPSGTTGGPMTFQHEGKQIIVVAIGALGTPAEWVALALE